MATASANLTIHHYKQTVARCDQCDKLPINATRYRARFHAASARHNVRFTVEDVTEYSKPD